MLMSSRLVDGMVVPVFSEAGRDLREERSWVA